MCFTGSFLVTHAVQIIINAAIFAFSHAFESSLLLMWFQFLPFLFAFSWSDVDSSCDLPSLSPLFFALSPESLTQLTLISSHNSTDSLIIQLLVSRRRPHTQFPLFSCRGTLMSKESEDSHSRSLCTAHRTHTKHMIVTHSGSLFFFSFLMPSETAAMIVWCLLSCTNPCPGLSSYNLKWIYSPHNLFECSLLFLS